MEELVEDYIMILLRYFSYLNLRKVINDGEEIIVFVKYLGNYFEVKNIYE